MRLLKNDGFTLVEMLITTVIVSGMIIAVVNLFISIDSTQRQTRRLETATRVAEAKIESLRNNHYNTLTPDTNIDFTAELPAELPEPHSATVAITEPEEGMRRLEVSITYRDGPRDKNVKLSALIGSIGIAQ